MNFLLRQQEEDEDRGWSSVGEKWTCPDHVEDDALEALIVENATSTACSYCDRQEEKPFAADVDLVVERIGTSLPHEWGNADNEGVGWEGGYVHKTWDTWDLITEAIDSPLNDGDLISDVVGALPEHAWVQRDFYRLSGGDRLIFGWEDFCRIVKHRHRYFFWEYREKEVGPFDDLDSITPGEMLSAIGEAVVEGELIRPLSAVEKLYRVRAHSNDEEPTNARDLGAPPAARVASSGRMNPAGVSLLYAAFDEKTAEVEAREANPHAEAFTLAEFEADETVRVIDLSKRPDVPSLLDEERRHLRPSLIFLRHFVSAIAEPFVHDERIHIEYVPTQIVTEWLASRFEPPIGRVHGMLFQSARTDGVNAALFVDNDGIRDPGAEDGEACFELRSSARLS